MIAFLQINANKSGEAQALALQTMVKKGASVLCISELNNIPDHSGWVGSTDGKCAIYLDQDLEPLRTGSGKGFAWADLDTLKIYSCYISPNCRLDEFQDFLNSLEHSIRSTREEIILAGDFNAHAQIWGSPMMDQRGEALLEMAESLSLTIINDGKVPTFPRAKSFLDLTFASQGAFGKINIWKVLEQETLSDHQYVFFKMGEKKKTSAVDRSGWS